MVRTRSSICHTSDASTVSQGGKIQSSATTIYRPKKLPAASGSNGGHRHKAGASSGSQGGRFQLSARARDSPTHPSAAPVSDGSPIQSSATVRSKPVGCMTTLSSNGATKRRWAVVSSPATPTQSVDSIQSSALSQLASATSTAVGNGNSFQSVVASPVVSVAVNQSLAAGSLPATSRGVTTRRRSVVSPAQHGDSFQSSAYTKTGTVASSSDGSIPNGVENPNVAVSGTSTGKHNCPLRGFDGCKNGIDSRGYGQSSLGTHLLDKHYPDDESVARCRQLISSNFNVFKAWECTLQGMGMWLCSSCMHLNAWRKPCRRHNGNVILRPWNGKGVDFLVQGITCPVADMDSDVVEEAAENVLNLNLELLDRVLQSRINTVPSIPSKCKLLFARTFNAAIQKVINNPNDISSWVQLLLFPICTLRTYFPKNSAEEKSGNRKKLQNAAIHLALQKWSEPNGCVTLLHRALEEQASLQEERQKNKKKNPEKTQEEQEAVNIRLCRKKLSNGLYTAAIRTLTSNGVAPPNSGTLEELQAKHPHAAPPLIPTDPISQPPFVASKDLVLNKLKSFPRGTSCGRDGLRAQHLVDALSGSAAAVSDELINSITGLVNIWLAGGCPSVLGEFVASAPLTPLLKPGGGIRPIAVGTIWRRLVSKVAASHVGKEMENYLGDFQFGVGVPCGGESILHAVNRLLEAKSDSTSTSMLLVDFSNAFNL